jgi:predicted NBD/HSP70 family sugar kinase
MPIPQGTYVVGLDNGGNKNNATVLEAATSHFLVESMVETPSRVLEGPEVAVEALAEAFAGILARTGVARGQVRVVGLDTPGPATAEGVISARGSTNFVHEGWRGFDFRGALETRLGLPVVYNNDGNAAASTPTTCSSARKAAGARRSPRSWAPAWAAASSRAGGS